MTQSAYEKKQLEDAARAIAQGHGEESNLRELLILTTSKTTYPMISLYFRQHHHDKELLRALVSIALEGEDAGDAPWAAANTIAEFPRSMLIEHKAALLQLSEHDWDYLKTPALAALAKLEGDAT